MKIGSLFVALGFDVDDKKLKSFNDSLQATQKSMVALTVSTAAGVYALNRFLNEGVTSSTALKNFTEQTGYATDEVYKFFNVASRANTDFTLDDAINTWKKLGDVIAGIQRGEFPEGAMWQNFGLSVNDNPETAIQKIREAIPRLMKTVYSGENGKSLLTRDLSSMGLDGAMQAFLLPKGQWEAWEKMPQPTEAQWKAMQNLSKSYREFNAAYFNFKMSVGEKIAPEFEKFITFVSTKALPVLDDFLSNTLTQLAPKMEDFALNMGMIAGNIKDFFSSMDIKIDESTGVIGFLVLLWTKLNPVRIAVVALVAALNELGKIQRGEDSPLKALNWEDQKDSWAALYAHVVGSDKNGLGSDRLKKLGLSQDDFGTPLIRQGLQALDAAGRQAAQELAARQAMADNSQKTYTTTNNIEVSSTASARELADEMRRMMFTYSAPQDALMDGLYGSSGNVNSGTGM